MTRAGAAATAPSSSIPKISARCSFPIAPSVGAAFASAPAEDRLGPAPLGGFFCNGEIGPVGGTTFLHGYTSAFAIFREAPGR